MISHIDLKSNCSEFVQCIELLLIAELMRLLQAALFLFLLVEELEGVVCCAVFCYQGILKEGTHTLVSSQIGPIAYSCHTVLEVSSKSKSSYAGFL